MMATPNANGSLVRPYTQLPGFEHVVLEESFVLRIVWDGARRVWFRLDACLTPAHADFAPPGPGDWGCFRRMEVEFDADSVSWNRVDFDPVRDATGEVDFGHIDAYTLRGDRHQIEGEFGSVEIVAAAPQLRVLPIEPDPSGGRRR